MRDASKSIRALLITGPGAAEVAEVPAPRDAPGLAVIDVARVGICGTDRGLFEGDPQRLAHLNAQHPLRPGHEWSGVVRSVGAGVDPGWVGRRVAGDTMLGCGRCGRCRDGRHHLCADRYEVGVRGGWPGALAEQLSVPVGSLRMLPDSVDHTAGALVEPGGNARRAVDATCLRRGDRMLIIGPGTIGLLAAAFGAARGFEVHLLGPERPPRELTDPLGLAAVWNDGEALDETFDAIIDATDDPSVPAAALDLLEPGRRLVLIGLAGTPSLIDTRELVRRDVTVAGILGGSAGLDGTIADYAAGRVDPTPLVAATVGLDGGLAALAGRRPDGAGPGPKIHIDPTR